MGSFLLISLASCALAVDGDGHSLAAQDAGTGLDRLIDLEWERMLREHPDYASRLGDDRYGDRWPDVSLNAVDASAQNDRQILKIATEFDRDQLSSAARLNLQLFVRQYESNVRLQPHRLHLIPLNQREGIQDASNIADLIEFESVEDYEQWIRRLQAFPVYMANTMALMTQGIREGMLHPKIVMKRVPRQIRRQIVASSEESLFYEPFVVMSPSVSSDEQNRLRTAARKAITECILPSYRVFLQFFETKYLPACYDEAGCWQRPNGRQMYADLARHFTTTSLTPDEIHEIGQKEVARIRQQMELIQQQVGFAGSFHDFLLYLRTDPQFYFGNYSPVIGLDVIFDFR